MRVLYGPQIFYHISFVFSDHLLPDAISYAYHWSYRIGAGLRLLEEHTLHALQDNSMKSDREIKDRSPIDGTVPLDE